MRRWLRRVDVPARPAPVPARALPACFRLSSLKRSSSGGLRAAAAVRQGDLGYNERHAYFVR